MYRCSKYGRDSNNEEWENCKVNLSYFENM